MLLRYPPELLVGAMGGERYREGVVSLFRCLQCHSLNKQVGREGGSYNYYREEVLLFSSLQCYDYIKSAVTREGRNIIIYNTLDSH